MLNIVQLFIDDHHNTLIIDLFNTIKCDSDNY